MQHANSKKAQIVFEILAETLKEERLKQNKSIRLLADEFDIQKSMISRLENCKNEPKLISILTLCEALNIKPSDFFKKIENKLPDDFSLTDG